LLGLGASTRVDRLDVQWPLPSGKVESFKDLPADRYITVLEGEGIKET